MEQHYGFKKITIENIIEPDTLGIPCTLNQDEWLSSASDFLATNLSESVPVETRALYDVARGTMVYGLLFYPLYSMGTEQLFRVAENALRQKCMALNIQSKDGKMYFGNMINRLVKMSVIPKDRKEVWECFRQLRNIYSHQDSQTIIPSVIANRTLKTVAEQINFLFETA